MNVSLDISNYKYFDTFKIEQLWIKDVPSRNPVFLYGQIGNYRKTIAKNYPVIPFDQTNFYLRSNLVKLQEVLGYKDIKSFKT